MPTTGMSSALAMSTTSAAWSKWPWLIRMWVAPRERLVAAAGVEERMAEPGIDQQHRVGDLDPEAGMAEPGYLHASDPSLVPPRMLARSAGAGVTREGNAGWTGFARVNGYCERTDASYWSEPLNAVSNAAFLIAAALCWRMTGRDPGARLLVVILAAIGVGSYLFHTHARIWAMLGRRAADPGLHPGLYLSRDGALLRRAALGGARRRRGLRAGRAALGGAGDRARSSGR